jgi:tRNA 2-thiouridine synthesizing protein A
MTAKMLKEPRVLINRSSTDLLHTNVVKSFDSRGMACPYPSFETVKAMNSLKTGDVLEIITDSDESALKSIPAVCDNRKWEFLVLEEESKNTWRIRIRK